MATISSITLSTPKFTPKSTTPDTQKALPVRLVMSSQPWKTQSCGCSSRLAAVKPVFAAPDRLSDQVADSVKQAEEACSDDPKSGECVAAWDEVEELSAAASHARDKKKDNSDPLENYCKDNPETDECRTYDN